jgi:hypothetical protein
MDDRALKIRNYSWLMLMALPVAFWLSGWRGGVGLIIGWLATFANIRLMLLPLKKESEAAMTWQIEILKSVLMRYIIIIGALSISIFLKKPGLLWTGGSVLAGQLLLVLSISAKSRARGENHGH